MAPALLAFDGWPLAYAPFSPAAIHLLTLLEDQTQGDPSLVLLPAPSLHPLPEWVQGWVAYGAHPSRARLGWEQYRLPRQAAKLGASALHLVTPTPALVASIPLTCSPTQWNTQRQVSTGGIFERLRRSLAAGGMANLRRLDWPSDLPAPLPAGLPLQVQPPRVHPLFRAGGPLPAQPVETRAIRRPGLPDLDLAAAPFFLYAGPADPGCLRLLLAGWSWASPALGEDFWLVLPNLPASAQAALEEPAAGQAHLTRVVRLSTASLPGLAWLYRQSAAVVQLAPSRPWGDPASLVLAGGRPLIAFDDPWTAARAGPAAFLTPAGDARLLGAALVTVGSDEALAQALADAARQRSSNWL